MDLNERLAQCRKDKEAVEQQEKKLLEQIKKESEIVWKHGDTARSLYSLHYTYKRIVLFDNKGVLNWFTLTGNRVSTGGNLAPYAYTNKFEKTGNIFGG